MEKEIQRWECTICGSQHRHSKRPTRCSCKSGYVKHIKVNSPSTSNTEKEVKQDGNKKSNK